MLSASSSHHLSAHMPTCLSYINKSKELLENTLLYQWIFVSQQSGMWRWISVPRRLGQLLSEWSILNVLCIGHWIRGWLPWDGKSLLSQVLCERDFIQPGYVHRIFASQGYVTHTGHPTIILGLHGIQYKWDHKTLNSSNTVTFRTFWILTMCCYSVQFSSPPRSVM